MEFDKIYCGHAADLLATLPDECVDCCVTSPPYYGLRNYGVDGQIGLEATPDTYIDRLRDVFRQVRRVMKPAGTLWVNVGDSYAGGGGGNYGKGLSSRQGGQHPTNVRNRKDWLSGANLKAKDLIGIPWMLAFALRADGWFLRQDIIWSKPNPMPESVTDRCTKAHEYLFLLSKSARYYFDADAIKQPAKPSTISRIAQDVEHQAGSARSLKTNGRMKAVIGGRKRQRANESLDPSDPMYRPNTSRLYEYTDRVNKRSVWEVPTMPFKEAHFAVYPEKLIVDCIKAGCPEDGIVLDPFMGSGTTALVARKLNRHFVGCELNPYYVQIADERLKNEIGLFL